MTSGPLRYYAPIQGHELVTRRDLIPSEPDHPRANQHFRLPRKKRDYYLKLFRDLNR